MGHSKWIVRDCGYDIQALLKQESVFSTSNGYLGVRGNFEEGCGENQKTIRGAYINGCYDITGIDYDEKLFGFPEHKQTIINIHDFQTVYLSLDEEPFDLATGRIIRFERILDMRNGIATRAIEWESPSGKRVQIEINRMVSFDVRELFVIDYRVTPLNFSGMLHFVSEAKADVLSYCDAEDPRTKSCPEINLRFVKGDITDGILYLESETLSSKIGLATAVTHTINKQAEFSCERNGMTVGAGVQVYAEPNERIRLVKYVHCLDGEIGHLKEKALSLAVSHTGSIDALYRKQRAYLDGRWAMADISVDSADDMDESLRYCVYQMICQAARCDHSIPAKGLSGEGYEGHYFWDTEVFIHPFYVLTDPERARELILYRYSMLDAARENARRLGHRRGAAYPWRTISGSECSTFFPAGSAQYHINADIAYALIHYYCATGDEELLLREGAEILFETARLWMELGHFHEGTFRIDTVTGPDEYTAMVDNNYYTNMMARHNLMWAVKVYCMLTGRRNHGLIEGIGLTSEEVEAFEKSYQNMYLPYDEDLGITPQDDSFLSKKRWDIKGTPKEEFPLLLHYHPLILYRHQVCKQADALLTYYLFPRDHDRELMARSYDYYEQITTHDSTLSVGVFSILASRLGQMEKAYDYFRRTVRVDMDDTHGNTKDGLHMANMGGSYLCVLGGFAGLIIDDTGVELSPVIPESWQSYRFRFMYRGSVFEVLVDKEGTEVTRIEGKPREIRVNGKGKVY